MKKPELLAPAGNLEKLKIAILYGADAVFIGGQEFGLRSNSDNFSIEDIKEGVLFANEYGVNIYVTANIYAHQENFIGFQEFVIQLQQIGVKGIIISDPGYMEIAREYAPDLELHISTQQSLTNKYAVDFYQDQGCDRVVLARELSFLEIKEICESTNMAVEVFIHGAVCSSYSGRCTLSNHMTSRDSNRGGCSQSCRWEYDLCTLEDQEFKKIASNTNDTPFTMSAKDMTLLKHIPTLCEIGVDSLKIEGRMKSFHYIATVVRVYRTAIDAYINDPKNYKVLPEWIEELEKCEARETYEGALIGDFSSKGQIYKEQYNLAMSFEYCGYVKGYDKVKNIVSIQQRNYFKIGDTLEFFGPNNKQFLYEVKKIYDKDMNLIQKANHPLMQIYLEVDQELAPHWLVRRIKK